MTTKENEKFIINEMRKTLTELEVGVHFRDDEEKKLFVTFFEKSLDEYEKIADDVKKPDIIGILNINLVNFQTFKKEEKIREVENIMRNKYINIESILSLLSGLNFISISVDEINQHRN